MVHPFCDLGRQRKIADRGSEETDQYIAKLTGVRGPRPKLRAGQVMQLRHSVPAEDPQH